MPVIKSNSWVFPTSSSSTSSYPPHSLQGWDFSSNQPSQQHKANPKNATSLDPWSKLNSTSSSTWDKFDNKNVPSQTQTDWNKLTQSTPRDLLTAIPNENIWNKFDDIWKKIHNICFIYLA